MIFLCFFQSSYLKQFSDVFYLKGNIKSLFQILSKGFVIFKIQIFSPWKTLSYVLMDNFCPCFLVIANLLEYKIALICECNPMGKSIWPKSDCLGEGGDIESCGLKPSSVYKYTLFTWSKKRSIAVLGWS